MNTRTVLGSFLIGLFYALVLWLLPKVGIANIFVLAGIATFVLVLGTKAIFTLVDNLLPPPEALTGAEVKAFFTSKTFWLSLVSFISVAIQGLWAVEIDPATQIEIVELDWTNVLQAVVSVIIIAIRKFDILKLII